MEAMYERSREKRESWARSTFTFTRDLSYIVSILLKRVKFTYSHLKVRESGNPPLPIYIFDSKGNPFWLISVYRTL